MEAYVFWLVVALIMAIVEIFSSSLVSLWFVVGALVSFIIALAGGGEVLQLIAFLVVSIVCLVAFRPLILKNRERGMREEASMIGKTAVVCESVDNGRLTGRVQTSDDMTWAARSANGAVLPVGCEVYIVGQESVKLIVVPVYDPSAAQAQTPPAPPASEA